MDSIFDDVYWGNTVLQYIIAAGGILVAWAVIRIIKGVVLSWIKKLTARTETSYDDILLSVFEKFIVPYLYISVNYSIIQQLSLHPKLDKALDVAMAFVTVYYAVRLINHVLHLLVVGFMRKRGETEERIRQLTGMMLVFKAFVWVVGIVTLASNFGYNVTTIIGGLGIGGIAIALASQAVLGDLFSYLVIFFDKPFEIGDFIIMGDKMGAIEYIGIKTTRIRALTGEQLVISNTQLTNSVIHNYKRMERRRIVFSVGVIYQTTSDQLKMIPGIIKDIITSTDNVQFDRSHLSAFADFSINFETVYYVLTGDFNQYMDVQQMIYQRIFEAFETKGIEFAYPTQTLFVEKTGAEK